MGGSSTNDRCSWETHTTPNPAIGAGHAVREHTQPQRWGDLADADEEQHRTGEHV